MSHPSFDAADWYRALTLSERANRLRSAPPVPTSSSVSSEAVRHRLQSWKKQAPFAEGEWLIRRLTQAGLDGDSFSRLLTAPPEQFRSPHAAPAWISEVRAAYSEPDPGHGDPLLLPDATGKDSMGGFLRLLSPVLHRARRRLRSGIESIA